MRSIIISLVFLLLSGNQNISATPSPLSKASYVTIKAREGDGVYSMLRKYKLLEDPANLKLFYAINKMKPNSELVKGRIYKLPLFAHPHDGRSLKSSLGWNDGTLLKGLENYNNYLVKEKLKPGSKTPKTQKIYVPEINKILRSWADQKIEKTTNSDDKSDKFVAAQYLKNDKPIVSQKETQKLDRKQQYLIAGMGKSSAVSNLVAERKLSPGEVELLNPETNLTSSLAIGSAVKVSSKSLNVPLFGKRYEKVDVKTADLNNQVFYIVPGHGGPDPGAIAKNVDGQYTICEDEYAYDVSLRLAKNLMENGAIVYIIVEDENDGIRDEMYLDCDQDETNIGGYKIPINQKKRLKQGISKVNKLYKKYKKKGFAKQWMLSLHIDAQSEANRQDVFFYYQSESTASKKKAIDIQNVFEEKYQVYRKTREYNGTVSARPLYVVRNSDPEPVFIELANIHNPEDRKRILFPKNRQLLADWITEGFMK
ncbi:MAG: N-acetylmuramoyl-L-alanine amidase [Saprospiraceae bacterium]|nr:N-acetylmuramoyl-L-alanine amidase [Saprospiraceae bacterium]